MLCLELWRGRLNRYRIAVKGAVGNKLLCCPGDVRFRLVKSLQKLSGVALALNQDNDDEVVFDANRIISADAD